MNRAAYRFVSARGNRVEVFNVREVAAHRVNGFVGFDRCSASFAMVNGRRVDCEAGCAYQAPSRVAAAGF